MVPTAQEAQHSQLHDRIIRGLEQGARIFAAAGAVSLLAGCGSSPQASNEVHTQAEAGQPPSPASSGDPVTVERPSTTDSGPTAIHSVDLTTTPMAPGSCEDRPGITWPDHMVQGVGVQDNGHFFSRIDWFGTTVYGDVTGDGQDDAIITVECNPGNGDPISYYPEVFTLDHGKAKQIGSLLPPPFYAVVAVKPADITVDQQGVITVKEWLHNKGDAPGHSSGTGYVDFVWNGKDSFDIKQATEGGKSVLTTVPTTPTSEKVNAAGTINETGVGSVKLGMDESELEAGGYTETSGCGQAKGLTGNGTPDGLSIIPEDGKVKQIQFSQGAFKTPEGVGIGSTLDDLEKAYPDAVVVEKRDGNGPYTEVTRDTGDTQELFAITDNGSGDKRVQLGAVVAKGGTFILC